MLLPDGQRSTYLIWWAVALFTLVVVLVLLVWLLGDETTVRWVEGVWRSFFPPQAKS